LRYLPARRILRRSQSACSLAKSRYIVRIEHKYRPSSIRVAYTWRGARSMKRSDINSDRTWARCVGLSARPLGRIALGASFSGRDCGRVCRPRRYR
jgi:hypothetical protein